MAGFGRVTADAETLDGFYSSPLANFHPQL